jgi:hypothetical protein
MRAERGFETEVLLSCLISRKDREIEVTVLGLQGVFLISPIERC